MSLTRIARPLTEAAGQEALETLLRMVALSAAVGNLDMHAKNVSLLHHPDGTLALAPAYDVVPQAHQKNDGELALAVAGAYRHAEITRAHLIEEGRSWGLRDAERTIHEVLEIVLETAGSEVPHAGLTLGWSRTSHASREPARRTRGRPANARPHQR